MNGSTTNNPNQEDVMSRSITYVMSKGAAMSIVGVSGGKKFSARQLKVLVDHVRNSSPYLKGHVEEVVVQ